MPDRDTIIQTIVRGTEPLDHVHALWEGGSVSFNRFDKWSDIDLYIVVDDDKVEQTSEAIEKILASISPIDLRYEASHPQWPFLKHVFYHLEGTSEHLLVDIAILKLNAPEHFLELEIHGKPIFLLNKGGIMKAIHVDKDGLRKKLAKRLDIIKAKLDTSKGFVQKEVFRDNSIDALGLYHSLIIHPLIEVLRIKYYPYHYDFGPRYLHHELPRDILDDLVRLYYVKDMKELESKMHNADRWLRELLDDMGTDDLVK